MSETVPCPDCGHPNPPGAESCEACGFPLVAEPAAASGPSAPDPAVPPATPASTPESSPTSIPPFRGRPRRPPRSSTEALSLWLVFGTLMALVVLYVAIKANVDRARQQPEVEGSNASQQALADSLFHALQHDSTSVEARVRLGDLLYDTGNWNDAIVHYRAALRLDSTLTNALVDLGVCYFNLSRPDEAERHFELALRREPTQPVALFNLGIVHEQQNDYKGALDYFHRSLQASPRQDMRQAVLDAMARVQQKSGVRAPPLGGGG